MIPVSERLEKVLSMVPPCHTAADIGTDHGYVPAFLAMSGRCEHVIASDIAEGPCTAARETQIRYGLQGVMDVRMAAGLQGLAAGEAQAVVIAGMGGATILGILAERPDITQTVDIFVLQPMNAARLLRQWLTEHCFMIADEVLCKENGHMYVVMKAVHAEHRHSLSEIELEIGPCLLQKKPVLLQEYIADRINRYRYLLTQMDASETARRSEKYKRVQNLLELLEAMHPA